MARKPRPIRVWIEPDAYRRMTEKERAELDAFRDKLNALERIRDTRKPDGEQK